MTMYVPSDNPQPAGSRSDSYLEFHVRYYLAHGPPPSNFHVERVRRKGTHGVFFMDLSLHQLNSKPKRDPKLKGMSWEHPLSPTELRDTPNVAPEMILNRKDCMGFSHPPVDYAPDMFDWVHHNTWGEALTATTIFDGDLNYTRDGKKHNPTLDAILSLHDKMKINKKKIYESVSSRTLYHPDDRDSAVFMDEVACSITAHGLGRSLIIVCPKVNADGLGWERIWDTHNRPPVYARWSTGAWQSRDKPLVLGCIPKMIRKEGGREFITKECYWFNLTPKLGTAFQKEWSRMFNKIDVRKVASDMNITPCTSAFFSWVLAATHYKIVTGTKISNPDLGSWIHQHAEHAKSQQAAGGGYLADFTYDPAKRAEYRGINITSRELAGWVMGNQFGCKEYAARYDHAFNLFIKWEASRSVTDWQDFTDKIHVAGTPPPPAES